MSYRGGVTDRLFGVPASGDLNDDALGQALDTLAELDLTRLFDECCRLCTEHYGFVSYILHSDSTNFSVRCVFKDDPGDGTPVPRHSGHAKDLHHELMQYCLQVITDSNRVIRYMKPYSGNVSDYTMNAETLEFIRDNYADDLDKIVYIADSKMLSKDIMAMVKSMGIGFVSHCPEQFGDRLRDRAIAAADAAGMTVIGETRYFDTHLEAVYKVNNRVVGREKLRCVVHRDETAVRAKIHAMTERLTEIKEMYAPLEKREAASSEEGARKAFLTYRLDEKYDFAKITPRFYEVPVRSAGGGGTRTMWKVEAVVELDEARARDIAERQATNVIVTNLPRSKSDQKNPRRGMTAMGLISLYAGEYRVEHSFRLLKSGMGLDSVYLQNPSRESAMMFVLSIAGLLMSTANAVLRRQGDPEDDILSMYQLARMFQGVSVELSRSDGSLGVRYPEECEGDLFEYTDMLGINPQFLLGYRHE